jgi:hypothetical protein
MVARPAGDIIGGGDACFCRSALLNQSTKMRLAAERWSVQFDLEVRAKIVAVDNGVAGAIREEADLTCE